MLSQPKNMGRLCDVPVSMTWCSWEPLLLVVAYEGEDSFSSWYFKFQHFINHHISPKPIIIMALWSVDASVSIPGTLGLHIQVHTHTHNRSKPKRTSQWKFEEQDEFHTDFRVCQEGNPWITPYLGDKHKHWKCHFHIEMLNILLELSLLFSLNTDYYFSNSGNSCFQPT